mgnify:CR=1 FL=1
MLFPSFREQGTADHRNRESEPTPNPSQEGNGNRESGIGNRRVGSGYQRTWLAAVKLSSATAHQTSRELFFSLSFKNWQMRLAFGHATRTLQWVVLLVLPISLRILKFSIKPRMTKDSMLVKLLSVVGIISS